MPVALDHLRGDRRGRKSQPRADALLSFRPDMREGSHGARDLAYAQVFGSRTQPFQVAPRLATVAGAPTFLQPVQDLRIGGRPSSSQYQYTLQGESYAELARWAPRLVQRLRTVPGLADVTSDQQDRGLEASLVIDRATASRLAVSPALIDDIAQFRESSGASRLIMIWCGSTEVFHRPAAVHQTIESFEKGLCASDPE